MGSHPINLVIRFILELGALAAFFLWGWKSSPGPLRILLGLGVPTLAALVWGLFAVPNDPSRSGKAPVPIPGSLRLIIELLIFGTACWGLYKAGFAPLSIVGGVIVLIHYGFSYDRVRWLLRQ
jgi:hypothetical protein